MFVTLTPWQCVLACSFHPFCFGPNKQPKFGSGPGFRSWGGVDLDSTWEFGPSGKYTLCPKPSKRRPDIPSKTHSICSMFFDGFCFMNAASVTLCLSRKKQCFLCVLVSISYSPTPVCFSFHQLMAFSYLHLLLSFRWWYSLTTGTCLYLSTLLHWLFLTHWF